MTQPLKPIPLLSEPVPFDRAMQQKRALQAAFGHEPDGCYLSAVRQDDGDYLLSVVFDPSSGPGREYAEQCQQGAEGVFDRQPRVTARAR